MIMNLNTGAMLHMRKIDFNHLTSKWPSYAEFVDIPIFVEHLNNIVSIEVTLNNPQELSVFEKKIWEFRMPYDKYWEASLEFDAGKCFFRLNPHILILQETTDTVALSAQNSVKFILTEF